MFIAEDKFIVKRPYKEWTPDSHVEDFGESQHGIFPGRFQPLTNAHEQRIKKILQEYPGIVLTIVIGDVGLLNYENFLTPNERVEILKAVVNNRRWNNVKITVVQGGPPREWVSSLCQTIPKIDLVFSDNPFVIEPLRACGYKTIAFCREGNCSSDLRNLPFSKWGNEIPGEVFSYISKKNLHYRLKTLPSTGRYPFMMRQD